MNKRSCEAARLGARTTPMCPVPFKRTEAEKKRDVELEALPVVEESTYEYIYCWRCRKPLVEQCKCGRLCAG